MPKLRDIMVGEVVTIEANATVRNAVRLMNNREIGCLVVVQDGKPTGIVTERDMMKRVLVAARDPRAVEVAEVMSKPLLFLEPEKEIEDAVKLMFKHKIKKLPIIENGRLIGLVTLTDLINHMHTSAKKTPREMEKTFDARTHDLSEPPPETEAVQKAFDIARAHEEPSVKPPEKEGKGPSKCAGHFGYLASRPKNAPIPKECLTCPKVLECVMKKSDS